MRSLNFLVYCQVFSAKQAEGLVHISARLLSESAKPNFPVKGDIGAYGGTPALASFTSAAGAPLPLSSAADLKCSERESSALRAPRRRPATPQPSRQSNETPQGAAHKQAIHPPSSK